VIVVGELFTANTGTPGYKLTFEVIEGEHVGRRVWFDLWFTQAAMAITKRELAKIGVQQLEQLDSPLPQGIRAAVRVVVNTSDSGTRMNVVKGFNVTGIERPTGDAFEPSADAGAAPEFDPSTFDDAHEPPTPKRAKMGT